MAKETLLGTIELTKLPTVVIMSRKSSQTGEMVRGLFIPFEHNKIHEFPVRDDKGVIIEGESSNKFGFEFRILLNDEKDQYGKNGFIAKKLSKEDYENNKNNTEYLNKMQPILGNLIKLEQINPDSAGEPIPEVDEDSDLPF